MAGRHFTAGFEKVAVKAPKLSKFRTGLKKAEKEVQDLSESFLGRNKSELEKLFGKKSVQGIGKKIKGVK